MRVRSGTTAFVTAVVVMFANRAAFAQSETHQIIGTWRFVVPESNCTETYTFKSDGVRLFTSGDEEGESSYELSPVPEHPGQYVFTDTITRTNGKPDCEGDVIPVGDRAKLRIALSEGGDELTLCRVGLGRRCFGPFKRVHAS